MRKWRQEVGLSAIVSLARFADSRLHVINFLTTT